MLTINQSKKQIQQQFNRAALSYQDFAQVQARIAHYLWALLPVPISNVQRIIDLGAGTSHPFATILGQQHYFVLDLATKMLKQSPERLSAIAGDFEQMPIQDHSCDLVISNMALHWSWDIQKTFAEIWRILKKQGLCLFSLPIASTLGELRYAASLAHPDFQQDEFYSFHQIIHLLSKKFTLLRSQTKLYQLHFNNFQQILQHLKKTGTTARKISQDTTLAKKNFFQMLEHHYCHHFMSDHKLPLTYNIGFFVVRKKS